MAVVARREGRSAESGRNLRTALVFLFPWLVGMLTLWLIPTGLSLYFAFTDYTGAIWPPHWIGVDNFRFMFDGTDPDFTTTLSVTLWWVVFSVPSALIAGLLLALLLNSKVRGIAFYRTIFFLPSLVPFVGSALLFLWLLNPETGLVNQVLSWLHLYQPGWFTDPSWAKPGLLLQNIWASGATLLIFLAGLQQVPLDLYESASLDGAGTFARFRFVTLPIITPTIYFNLILGMINSFQYFAQAFVVSTLATSTGSGGGSPEVGGPMGSTLFLSLHIYDQAFQQGNVGYASALAWLLTVVVIVITLTLVRSSGRWVHYGG